MMEVVSCVEDWLYDKGLVAETDEAAKAQFLKMTEELGEIAECVSKGKDKEELEKEIGDLLVTTISFALQYGLHVDSCLASAYDKIKSRQGKTVNGVFVKEGD